MAFAFLADYSPPQSDGVNRQDSNMREIAEEEKNGNVVIKICVHESGFRVIVGGGGVLYRPTPLSTASFS
jgi:hypothetical protein